MGAYVRSQSGAPWEARGLPWGSTATLLRYLEPAGTNRIDPWTNLDVLASYHVPINGKTRVTVEGRVFNAFNNQPPLSVDKRKYSDGRIRAFTSPPGPDCDRACYSDLMVQGTTTPNARFGLPVEWAPQRRVLLTARLDF